MSEPRASRLPRGLLKGLLVLVSLVAVGFLFKSFGGGLDSAWIDDRVRGQGMAGELLFLAVGAAFTAVGLPRQVVAFLGGYAFDVGQGTVLALIATTVGCLATFLWARWLGRSFVAGRFGARIRRIDAFLARQTFSMTLLIRLLPVGSNVATNLAAGVSSVRAGPYVLGSALGYVPQTLVFALAGSGVNLDPAWRISLSAVLFLVSGLLGVHLFRKIRRARAGGADLDGGDDDV